MSTERKIEPRQGAQAIRRALAILRILAAGRETGLPLADVIQATGMTRPTVHRIVHALIEEGIVEQRQKTGRYAIGNQVPELALARPSPSPLLAIAEDVLRRTSRQIGDTLFLTVRTGNDTLCVDRRIGSYPIQVLSIEVGARRPLGVSSDPRSTAGAGYPQDRCGQSNQARGVSDHQFLSPCPDRRRKTARLQPA